MWCHSCVYGLGRAEHCARWPASVRSNLVQSEPEIRVRRRTVMGLLQQLESELARVGEELHRLTRERSVLIQQITRLRTGESPELVGAALRAAFGERAGFLLHAPALEDDRVPAAERRAVRGSVASVRR